MEIVFEIEPTKSAEKLRERIRRLEGLADWVDVPDSPMGTSRFSSSIISCMIKSFSGISTIAHTRLIDFSRIAAEALMASLAICGVERLALLRGDIVEGSTIVRDLEPEAGVELARRFGLRPGLIISLRKSYEEASKRLSLPAEFYLITNLSEKKTELLELIVRDLRARGARAYPYIIIVSERSREALSKMLPSAPLYSAEEITKIADALSSLSAPPHGLLISSPLAFEEGLRAARLLNRR